MQTKKMSMLETLASTAIGYSVATAANYYVLPLFGAPVSLSTASWIGIIFTGISLVRGYMVRRLFNWWQYYTKPSHYAEEEGGRCFEWGNHPFDSERLTKTNPYWVSISGRKVHALYFGGLNGRRWDSINGWNSK